MVMMSPLFLFRFVHIKILLSCASLPSLSYSHFPPSPTLPPVSLSLVLCFVCEDYVGKTSRRAEALRVQSHLCGGWEVKQCSHWRLRSGQSGEAGRRLVKMPKQVKDVSSCFQDPPQRLPGPAELPMWPASISFLQPVGLAG